MTKMKKGMALLLASMMALSALAGCGKDPGVDAPQTSGASGAAGAPAANTSSAPATTPAGNTDNTFIYSLGGDPGSNVNVITTSDRYGLMTVKMIYSPLCMYNAEGINWFLATSVDAADDKQTYTFHLRNDVKWSDGEPFNADDVVFTYTAMQDEKNAGWAYGQLVYPEGKVEVTKVDDYTVSFKMPFVNASAVEMLSNIFIMPEHLYKDVADFQNNDINVKPVGTGPYVMSEYSAGSYVKFTKNDTYFLGAPNIDTYIFRIIENADTAKIALQSGEVTCWIGTPADVAQMKLEENNLTVVPYSEGRIGHLMINANRVKDVRVRQAILYALNKKEINDACFLSEDNYAFPWSFIPPGNEFFTEDVQKYEQDLEKCKSLLAEAGVSNLKLTLAFGGSDKTASTQAVMIQEQLKKAGIEVTLAGGDAMAISQKKKDPANEYDMYLDGYIMGIDPDTFAPLFESGGLFNYMYYDVPEINDLFSQGRKETDPAKRKEIYVKLQQAIQDTACFYPIVSNKRLLFISKNVSGIDEAMLVPVYTFEDTSKLKLN